MNITFEVIDVSCEQADQSFFVPQIQLSAKSTTQFATLHGYSEFIPSSPPKKYRKVTIQGTAQRIGFTAEQTPRQCAGAQYVWSGFGEFNLQGVQTASYSKKFFAQCSKQFWPPIPVLINSFSQSPCATIPFCSFVGYCWPSDTNSCSVCDPNIVNWPFIGEQATGELLIDLSGFRTIPGGIVLTHTTYTVTGQFFAFTEIVVDPPYTATLSGVTYNVTVGSQTFPAQSVFTNPPNLTFPPVSITGFVAQYINFVDASNYSAVLSEEYLDSDALANAQVVFGTGTTAATTPRTTGFTSVFTSVVYTLSASNLIPGQNYLITVDLWEQGPNNFSTHTPKQYTFTAGSSTNAIVDIVPTPVANHTITVRNPKIAFQT